MTVTAKAYGKLTEHIFKGLIDFENDYIRGMLCTNEYIPNQDTHDFKDDVTHEVSGDGYILAGKLLENVVLAYDAATNTFKITADDLIWASSTITARYLVIYDATPASDTIRPLIGYVDFGEDLASSGGSFTVEWTDGTVIECPVA